MEYFWRLTPKKYAKHVKIFNEKEKARVEEKDKLNHIFGIYIFYAVNNPKEYPKKPFLSSKVEELKEMTASDMERQAKLNTIMQGGVIKNEIR